MVTQEKGVFMGKENKSDALILRMIIEESKADMKTLCHGLYSGRMLSYIKNGKREPSEVARQI